MPPVLSRSGRVCKLTERAQFVDEGEAGPNHMEKPRRKRVNAPPTSEWGPPYTQEPVVDPFETQTAPINENANPINLEARLFTVPPVSGGTRLSLEKRTSSGSLSACSRQARRGTDSESQSLSDFTNHHSSQPNPSRPNSPGPWHNPTRLSLEKRTSSGSLSACSRQARRGTDSESQSLSDFSNHRSSQPNPGHGYSPSPLHNSSQPRHLSRDSGSSHQDFIQPNSEDAYELLSPGEFRSDAYLSSPGDAYLSSPGDAYLPSPGDAYLSSPGDAYLPTDKHDSYQPSGTLSQFRSHTFDTYSDPLIQPTITGYTAATPSLPRDRAGSQDSGASLPSTRTKRRHSPSPLSDPEPKRKVQKVKGSTSRPRIADYDSATQEVLAHAIKLYSSYIAIENGYPDKLLEMTWAMRAWNAACDKIAVQVEHNQGLLKKITGYTTHLRGEIKSIAKSHVETIYGFESSGKPSVIAKNRRLAETLKKDSAFLYRKIGKSTREHAGLYQAKIIQKIANKLLYKNPQDDGVMLADVYDIFPLKAIALIATAVECAVDEWHTGTRTNTTFSSERYSTVYDGYVTGLSLFRDGTSVLDILPKIQKKISVNGWAHAGAELPAEAPPQLSAQAIACAVDEYNQKGLLTDEEDVDESDGADSATE